MYSSDQMHGATRVRALLMFGLLDQIAIAAFWQNKKQMVVRLVPSCLIRLNTFALMFLAT